jgi:hypothetical protein
MFKGNKHAKISVEHRDTRRLAHGIRQSILGRGGGSQSLTLLEGIEPYPLHWVAVLTSSAIFSSYVGFRDVMTWREEAWDETYLHISTNNSHHSWMRDLNEH